MSRSAFNQLQIIAQLHLYLDEGSLRTLVQGPVISWIDYCNALFIELPLSLIQRLQWVQNVMARLVMGVSKFDCITQVLARLHWLPIAS